MCPTDLTLDAQMSWIDLYGRERDVISKRLKSAYLAATKAMEEVH